MDTPMITNLKVSSSDLELGDPMLSRQSICSLMYLVNTRIDICFALNMLIRFMVNLR
jgi:hypothetical protein